MVDLVVALREHHPHLETCISCRMLAIFYYAVGLSEATRDFDTSRAMLDAIIAAPQTESELRARALNYRGMQADLLSHYSQALRLYRQAHDTSLASNFSYGQARALLNEAITWNNHLHDPVRALALLAQAEQALVRVNDQKDIVRVLNERGVCLMRLEQWAEARVALDATHDRCEDNNFFRAICETNLGSWERLQGRWVEARNWYEPALDTFVKLDDPWLQAEVLYYLSQVAEVQGHTEQAQTYLRAMAEVATTGNSPHFMALAHFGFARLATSQDEALAHYWHAVRKVEQIRAAQDLTDVRLDFQAEWQTLYRDAAACAIAAGRIDEALLFSEHGRARLLLDTLGPPPAAVPSDMLTAELEQARAVVQERTLLYLSDLNQQLPPDELWLLAERLQALRQQLTEHEQRLLPESAIPHIAAMRQHLPLGAAILVYYRTSDDLTAFIVDRDGLGYQPLGVAREHIANLLTPDGQVPGIVPDDYGYLLRQSTAAHTLHHWLLEPLAERLAAYTLIYVVPDTELRHVPFHLLAPRSGDQPDIINGQRLCYAPSASVLTRLWSRPLQCDDAPLVVGYNGDDLHLIEIHAQLVAKRFAGQALCGPQASPEQIMAALPNAGSIYIAGHNYLMPLQPDRPAALVAEVPGLRERPLAVADGGLLLGPNRLLTLREIQQLSVPASRIVLSACRSSQTVERGGDWVGLTSAFLRAGAAQVIGTLWDVSEIATCLLMDHFWATIAAEPMCDPLEALRQAQHRIRTLTSDDIRQAFRGYGLSDAAWAHLEHELAGIEQTLRHPHPLDHPYYWGSFVLVGN